MKKILIFAGTRPNSIKVPQFKKVNKEKFDNKIDINIAHTRHDDRHKMEDVFFERFKSYPDYFLKIPPVSPFGQIADRPSAIKFGSDISALFKIDKSTDFISSIENGCYKKGLIPPYWNGKATHRILELRSKRL